MTQELAGVFAEAQVEKSPLQQMLGAEAAHLAVVGVHHGHARVPVHARDIDDWYPAASKETA